MLDKKIIYLAHRELGAIPKIVDKSCDTEILVDKYINRYGLDFIGAYDTKIEALTVIQIDKECFPNTDFQTQEYLERCFQLEYKE